MDEHGQVYFDREEDLPVEDVERLRTEQAMEIERKARLIADKLHAEEARLLAEEAEKARMANEGGQGNGS